MAGFYFGLVALVYFMSLLHKFPQKESSGLNTGTYSGVLFLVLFFVL
jgi:hypothetical protein